MKHKIDLTGKWYMQWSIAGDRPLDDHFETFNAVRRKINEIFDAGTRYGRGFSILARDSQDNILRVSFHAAPSIRERRQ